MNGVSKITYLLSFSGYSAAALLAIIFALPFAWRVLVHKEKGHWDSPIPAYYFAHLELFLGWFFPCLINICN